MLQQQPDLLHGEQHSLASQGASRALSGDGRCCFESKQRKLCMPRRLVARVYTVTMLPCMPSVGCLMDYLPYSPAAALMTSADRARAIRDCLRRVIGARKIFQRMTTYAKYTVAMTFRICFTFGILTIAYDGKQPNLGAQQAKCSWSGDWPIRDMQAAHNS